MMLQEDEKQSKNWVALAKGLFIIGAVILVISPFAFWIGQGYKPWTPIKSDTIGQFGDFIGGVVGSLWALASFVLFYVALQLQRVDVKTNQELYKAQVRELSAQLDELAAARVVAKEQSKTLRNQQFDSTFFALLGQLQVSIDSFSVGNGSNEIRGNKAFVELYKTDLYRSIAYPLHILNGYPEKDTQRRFVNHKPKNQEEALEWILFGVDHFFKPIDASFRSIGLLFFSIVNYTAETNLIEAKEKVTYLNILKASINNALFKTLITYPFYYKGEPSKGITFLIKHEIVNMKTLEGFHESIRPFLIKEIESIRVQIGSKK